MTENPNPVDDLHPRLQRFIAEQGWKEGLRPVQKQSIPVILNGSDCIIEAPTAGGKTEAVFFPALSRAAFDKKNSVQVLYIAPLKALLNDIEKRADKYAGACGLRSFKWHGDVSQRDKIQELQNPPNLLLTTPESLEAVLLRKSGWQIFFADLQCIIIDEAHSFAAGDRGCHLLSLLERLEYHLEQKPQRIALTATIGNPEEMKLWLKGSRQEKVESVKAKGAFEKEKDYQIFFFSFENKIEKDEKTSPEFRSVEKLTELLPLKKSITFVRSRFKSERLAEAIKLINSKQKIPVKVRTHHSAVSKYYREEAEKKIKAKRDFESGIDSIISTSTLELGIDIGELDLVIQMDVLTSPGSFLQRVGRTGRREDKPQCFRGLCIDSDELLLLSATVSLGMQTVSEKIVIPKRAFHIMAHQIICLSLQYNGISSDRAWQILKNAYSFSEISRDDLNDLIASMISKKYLRKVDDEMVVGEKGEKRFLGMNWRNLFAVFETGPVYEVYQGKKHVGNLDSAFVELQEVPFFFILGGIEWKATNINAKSRRVIAERTKIGNAPRWIVFGSSDVPYETAQEVGRLISADSIPEFLDTEAAETFKHFLKSNDTTYRGEYRWLIRAKDDSQCIIWTYAGDKINRTLQQLINLSKIGKASSEYDHLHIKLYSSDSMQRLQTLFKDIKKAGDNEKEEILEKLIPSVKRTHFSKFEDCLPDKHAKAAVAERSYDIDMLFDLLRKTELLFELRI